MRNIDLFARVATAALFIGIGIETHKALATHRVVQPSKHPEFRECILKQWEAYNAKPRLPAVKCDKRSADNE